jgi:hypothetical protein
MTRRTLLGLLALAAAPAMSAQAPARLELVRCAAGSDVPCVRTRVTLGAAARAGMGMLDSSGESKAWSGELAGGALVAPGLAAAHTALVPTRLLVLIDRGSGMAGEGIAFTRIALKSWLSGLDSSAIQVAIAGFDGRDLAPQIAGVTFRSPAAVLAVVDSMPAPAAKGHSPLYSATLLGAERVAATVASSPGAVGGLLVITAGQNDVGRGRDAVDLLSGTSGLSHAVAGIGSAAQRTWIMALGSTDPPADDLRTLAGPAGSAYAVALNPNAIAARLAAIAREFIGARDLTFGVGAIGTAALARTAAGGAASLGVDSTAIKVAMLSWRPPLIAMPSFQAVADPSALSPALREALLLGVGGGSNRPFVALLMAALVAGIWLLVLRVGWRESIAAVPVARERASTTRTMATGVKTEEGAPRKPEDITHQTARRTAMSR